MIKVIERKGIFTTYMDFKLSEEDSEGKKTEVWLVFNKFFVPLGSIKWYPRWRAYCFFPETDTVFNASCLRDIEHVISILMQWRRDGVPQ